MLIEVGHVNGTDGLVVTQTRLSDVKNEAGDYLSSYSMGVDAQVIKEHLFDNPGLVTHLPGNTAILETVNPIRERVQGKPSWVEVKPEERSPEEAADFQRFLSEFFGCEAGKPADVEDTHWTLHSGEVFAPGDKPESEEV